MFTAVLFVIASNEEQPNPPVADEHINIVVYQSKRILKKIKRNLDMLNNVVKSQNNQAAWMKPDKHTSTSSMFPWVYNSRTHKLVCDDRGHHGSEWGEQKGARGASGEYWYLLSWWWWQFHGIYICYTCQITYFTYVKHIVCQLKLNKAAKDVFMIDCFQNISDSKMVSLNIKSWLWKRRLNSS